MLNKKLILLVFCCAASGSGMAQKMYKTVGPDGKITFSDRPQIDATTKVSVMRSNTLHSLDAPATQGDTAAGLKSEPRRKVAADTAAVITPEIEDAMVSVMGLTEFGRRFEGFCNDSAAEAKAFSAANDSWKQRNAAAVEQQRRLLAEVLSPVRRANLIDREQQQMGEELGKAAARDPSARKEWCDGVIADFNGGNSDVNQPAMMAVPLIHYRAR